jgi:hypothetical protein
MAVSELQQVVEQSELSSAEKDLWLRALEVMDDEQAQSVLEAVQTDPTELETLTRNLKVKQVAIATKDRPLMKQVLDEEVDDISHHE